MTEELQRQNLFIDCQDPAIFKALNGVALLVGDATLYSTEERLALELGELVTQIPDPEARKATLTKVRGELGDPAATALTWAAININAFNRVSILSHHPVTKHAYPAESAAKTPQK